MTNEIWKDVIGYSGLYQVSNMGRIKSLLFNKEKFLKPWKRKAGHFLVNLYINKKSKTFYLHKLIMEAFIGPCPDGLEVRHLDGNGTNNILSNLKYGTRTENVRDAIKHGTFKGPPKQLGSKNFRATVNEKQVIKVKKLLNNNFSVAQISKILNIKNYIISSIKKGDTWKHIQV